MDINTAVKSLVNYAIINNLIEKSDEIWAINSVCQALNMDAFEECEAQNAELEEICEILKEENIDFIPLKGAFIRNYYPEPWMRTSSY